MAPSSKVTVVIIVLVCAILAAAAIAGTYWWSMKSRPLLQLPPAADYIVLSEDPILRVHQKFMTAAEAAEVIALAGDRFNRSSVVLEVTGTQVADPARTSYSVYLRHAETPLIKALEQRAAALVGMPASWLECLQVVRYEHGQFYKPHYDYLPDNPDVTANGQRQATLFAYLNDLPEEETGGGTHFPALGKTVRPKLGAAALWMNVRDGKVDPRTLHGGEPVNMRGTVKYGMNFWFRDRPQK
jgi:prolyl 4-hydroxylase